MYGILFKYKNVLLDNLVLYKKRIIVFLCGALLIFLAGIALGTTFDSEKFTPIVEKIGDEKNVISVFFIRTLPLIAAILLFAFTSENGNFYLCGIIVSAVLVFCYGVGLGRIIGGFSFSAFISAIIALIPFLTAFVLCVFMSACLYQTYKFLIPVCGFDSSFFCVSTVVVSLINIIFYVVLLWIFSVFF